MSSRLAIGFSNCLGNFLIMTAALKILRERCNDEIFMVTDEDVLRKHPAMKAMAEKLFDGVITKYEKKEFKNLYVGDWSCPNCIVEKGDAHKSAVWWTGQSPYSGMHEVQIYLDMIDAKNSDFSGFLTSIADKPILTGDRVRIALANSSAIAGSRKGAKVGWRGFPELSKLLSNIGYDVILVGQGTELKDCVGLNFVGKLDIFETAKVLSQCDLVVATDTGLMHLADSLCVPLVVLAGPTPMTKAHPLVSKYRIVRKFISCAPCYQSTLWNSCSDPICMNNINVDDVLKAIYSFKLRGGVLNNNNLPSFVDKSLTPVQSYKNKSIKIVMPYYGGDQRIDAAVQTWPTDVLLLAITDEGTTPPSGYESFYTPDNAKVRGLSEKTKPISKDIFQMLLTQYPNEDFYGYANSDIILPPDTEVESLFPSEGYQVAVHHRLDIKGDISKCKNIVYMSGKDCFIWTPDVARKVADEYPELVLGSCNWDDGLVHWLWRAYGRDAIDIRYGEVWHKLHHPGWTGNDVDARFNGATLEANGITTALRHSYDWISEYQRWLKRKDKIGIIQPGRIGDILICLPIAKWYADRGYEVVWPVCDKYLSLFDYIDYVKPISAGANIGVSYQKSIEVLKGQVGKVINLGIGFGRYEDDWLSSGLTFDKWKYKEAGVPYAERYNLQIKRNKEKEESLKKHLNLTKTYIITHSQGESAGSFIFNIDGAVDVRPIDGYTLFDWLGILEEANSIHCINSCVMNLIESLGIGKNRRYMKLWDLKVDAVRAPLLVPTLSSDWKLSEDGKDILPVAFFTMVYDGMPFIKYHLAKFESLPFPWHWYIIEGLSQIAGDFGADGHRARGGHLPKGANHLSTDGTSEYLDKLALLPNVTVYRKGDIWPSKLKMINTPLSQINYECILWEIDVDEFYPLSSMIGLYDLFVTNPTKTAAAPPYFSFPTINKYVITKGGWGSFSYPRLWRYKSGCKWQSHEPPVLLNAKGQALHKLNSFSDEELKSLFYHHYNYIYSSQIRFKERYYGYENLYDGWKRMQETQGKVHVYDFYKFERAKGIFADDWQEEYLIPMNR